MLHFDCRLEFPGGFELNARFNADDRCTALFGPSGAGKTTVLKLIAGLLVPAFGRISLDEEVLFDSARSINVPIHRRGIGFVMQSPHLFPHLDVCGNLEFGRRARKSPRLRVDVDRLVDVLRLKPLLHRRPMTLSGGERSRVALGRALASGPRLLLMDEPLQSLDNAIKSEILDYLADVIAEWKVPTLLVTHNTTEAARIATKFLEIDRGALPNASRRGN